MQSQYRLFLWYFQCFGGIFKIFEINCDFGYGHEGNYDYDHVDDDSHDVGHNHNYHDDSDEANTSKASAQQG